MTRKLRVAVVGLGVGKGHLESYAMIPEHFEVAAVCDLDAAKAAAAAAAFGIARHTTQLSELLASGDIDIIDICTPPNTHLALIEQVLAAGLHAICEKPLVGSLAEADAVEKAEKAAKGSLFPIFQYRFGNGLQKLKYLQSKGFGAKALLTTIETHWRRDADYYAVAWRGKWATEKGGCCLTHASHAHDILSYVNGPVKNVYARLATRVNDVEVEDCASIAVELKDGSSATLSVTLGAAEERSRLCFVFSDMTVTSDSPDPYRPGKETWHFKGKTPEIDAAITDALKGYVPTLESFEGQFVRIHATITEGAEKPVSIADARAALELITAIYHSGETGNPVTLPIGLEHPKYSNWTPVAGGFSKTVAHV